MPMRRPGYVAGPDQGNVARWILSALANYWRESASGSSGTCPDVGMRTVANRARKIPPTSRSELYQDELDEGLADDLREELAAVERAEARLAAGTYGLSIESGEPIPDERLEAVPTAERTAKKKRAE